VVLVECTQEYPGRDANTNRFIKTCDLIEAVPERLARKAGLLQSKARQGSAVDALVVAFAEPAGNVITGDLEDIEALAAFTEGVNVVGI
jgi:hypothetical protein